MPNLHKRDYVENLVSQLHNNSDFIVVGLSKTTHKQLEDFRTELRGLDDDLAQTPKFIIIKNTLFRVAFTQHNAQKKTVAQAQVEEFVDAVTGETALMLLPQDWTGGLKAFQKFAKDLDGATFKVGIIDGQVYYESGLKQLADLPSKEELVARLIGTLKAPHSRLVFGLKFNTMKLVHVLKNASAKEN